MDECSHEFKESYYGWQCEKCDMFHPHGCAPWDEEEEEPKCEHCGKPIYDFDDIGCAMCDARVRGNFG